MKNKLWMTIPALGLMFLAACGGGGGDSSSSGSAGSATGTISVTLTDASTTSYKAVYVTVKQVEVQKNGSSGWNIISTPNKTYNLLELVNGAREDLALAELETGHYNQMRLILADKADHSINLIGVNHPYANYFIDNSDQSIELKVPSGYQTGIKIVKGFDISTNLTTELLLDFDATRSIVKAGNSGKWLLKPTIKMLTTKECSIIEGNAGTGGVLVSAQIYNASLTAIEDRVEIAAATVSEADGKYKLFLAPGTYTLVGYKEKHVTYYKATKIVTVAGNTYTEDFSIGLESATGTLAGGVSISGANDEQYATFSIRQSVTVGGNSEKIEVKSFNVADGGTFPTSPSDPIYLPVKDDYSAVISTYGKTTQEKLFSIVENVTTSIGTIAL